MVKGKIKLFSVFCVAAALCLIPALSDAAEIPGGNPTQANVAWWSVNDGNGLYAGVSSFEMSGLYVHEKYPEDDEQYRGVGDFAFGVAFPGGKAGFESPDGISAAYFINQLRRTDKFDSGGKPQRVDGGYLCFNVEDGFYTSGENEFSFYIEYLTTDRTKLKVTYPRATSASSYVFADINATLTKGEEWNVCRIDVSDAWLQSLTSPTRHSVNQIILKSDSGWQVPRKPSVYIRRFAIAPKSVAETLKNPDNIFDLANYEKSPGNSAVLDGEVQISYSGNNAAVTVNLKNIDYEDSHLNLVAYAFNPENDYISSLHRSVTGERVGPGIDTLQLSTTVTVPQGYELRYIIADDDGKVIDNAAPAAMGDITVDTNMRNVTISWDAPKDDFGCSYVIYKNGAEIGTTKETFYKDEDAAGNETYAVKAVDHAGVETELSEPKASSELAKPYYVLPANPVSSNGLNVFISDDPSHPAYCVPADMDGESCITTVSSGDKSTYLYITADEDAIGESDRDVTVLVDYYDDGTDDAIFLEYAGYARKSYPRTAVPYITGTDGDGWKQAVFRINNAYFTRMIENGSNDKLYGCDFRLSRRSGAPLAVSKVEEILTSQYE